MAQHGYLREYDEGWDRGDDRDRDRSWRDEDRERGWRGSGGEGSHRERGWRDDERDFGDRNRNFMFGDRDRGGERGGDRDQDRGLVGRMGDEARSWFRDDDRQYRGTHQGDRGSGSYGREHGFGGFQGDFSRSGWNQGGFGGRGDWDRSPRNFSSHQDDHYRSWRDRQMAALDRDYADYCREREQQFHSDFDSWRRNRQQQPKPGRAASEPTLELNQPAAQATETGGTTSPMGAATLGTNNPENEGIGRGRR
jgi:hypothetical protein